MQILTHIHNPKIQAPKPSTIAIMIITDTPKRPHLKQLATSASEKKQHAKRKENGKPWLCTVKSLCCQLHEAHYATSKNVGFGYNFARLEVSSFTCSSGAERIQRCKKTDIRKKRQESKAAEKLDYGCSTLRSWRFVRLWNKSGTWGVVLNRLRQ